MVQCITTMVGTTSKNHIISYIEHIYIIYMLNFNFNMYIIRKKIKKN